MEFYAGMLALAVLLAAGYVIYKRNFGDKAKGGGKSGEDQEVR